MAKLLLIIDPQNDFINGSLMVGGALEAIHKLAKHIDNNFNEYVGIAVTADWHPYCHCSFKENGGEWPMHCVQHSQGAAILNVLLKSIIKASHKLNDNIEIFTKGTNSDREEYSVFKNVESSEKLVNMCELLNIDEIDICGLALDYCVFNSLKDGLRWLPNVKFNLIREFSPSIGKIDDVEKFVNESERVGWK